MWRYSTAKFFLLLLLVEVSLGRYLADLDSSSRSNVSSITTLEDLDPNGNVTIKFDIMSETSDSYTANVTILNYFKNKLKNHEIVGPWELGWIWMEDEILLSTVGAKGTQSGYDLTGDYRGGLNSVVIVDSPSKTNGCKGSVIPSFFREADLAKSSTSFQISVTRANVEYHAPPVSPNLTTPTSEYACDVLGHVISTPGYLDTLETICSTRPPLESFT